MVRSSPRARAGLSRLAASPWPAGAAGADHGVGLVDEQDDRLRRRLDLGDDRLQPVLELPLDPGAGLEQPEVERAHATLLRSDGGTSPAAIRSANPSTTAVLPTPASPVRIGLFCRRRIRMSITWRISASRPMTGSISPGAGACGQVDRELVERRRRRRLPLGLLAAGGRRRRGGRRRLPDAHVLDRPAEQVLGVLPQWIAGDLPQRRHGLQDHPAERVVVEQGEQQRAGAHRRGAELERGREPRLAEELEDLRREGRRAGVPGIEPAEGLLHLGDQERAVEPVLPQRPPEVGVLAVGERQQLGQQVLDLDVVMGPRDAQPGRLFQRPAAERAQLVDEGLQVEAQGGRGPPIRMKQDGVEDRSRKRVRRTAVYSR